MVVITAESYKNASVHTITVKKNIILSKND